MVTVMAEQFIWRCTLVKGFIFLVKRSKEVVALIKFLGGTGVFHGLKCCIWGEGGLILNENCWLVTNSSCRFRDVC